jgi:hypothetical protein
MGGTVVMKVPVGTTNLAGMICETDLVFKVSADGASPQTMSDTELCDCKYCRESLGKMNPRNVSPIAAIDVYSLPDEADKRTC